MHIISILASGVSGAENGTADIYVHGTSTRAAYYSDVDGTAHETTAATLTLDANGGAVVYVNRQVDIRVYDDTGESVREWTETVTAPLLELRSQSFTGTSPTTAQQAASLPVDGGTVADRVLDSFGALDWEVLFNGVSTRLQDALGSITNVFYNVKSPEYGATGDGATDDSTPIQAAITAAGNAGGGIVFFPKGNYRVTQKLTVPVDVSLWGVGYGSQLGLSHATNDLLEYGTGTASQYQEIRGMYITASGAASGKLVSITGLGERKVAILNSYLYGFTSHTGDVVDVGNNSGETHLLISDSILFCVADGTKCVDMAQKNNHYFEARNSSFRTIATAFTSSLVNARNAQITNCWFDFQTVSSGTMSAVKLTGDGATYGARAIITGNRMTPPASGTSYGFEMASANAANTLVTESGTIFESGFTQPYTGMGATTTHPQVQLLTRDQLIYNVAHSSGALDIKADQYGTTVIQQSSADSFTISTASLPPENARWTLIFFNNSGGASGTITYGTGFRAGLSTFTAVTNQKYEVREFQCIATASGTELVPLTATGHNI